MKEQMKTVLLTLLVAASLVQSYLLANSSPQYDSVVPTPTDYVESEWKGTRLELDTMIYPEDILIHFENGENTILYPQMTFYRMIMEVVQQRAFDGIRLTDRPPSALQHGTAGSLGLEMRFGSGLPMSVLQETMQLSGENIPEQLLVNRLVLSSQVDREEVRVYLVDDQEGSVYEATRADLTARDIERFVGFGSAQPRYTLDSGDIYVPAEPLPIIRYRMSYREFTAEQLQRSLFPDPFNTRNLRERNGSQIYTDGKRGLQLSADQRWMSYTDPAAPVEGNVDPVNTALSAVQFVNRHGGWNGDYQLSEMAHAMSVGDQRTLVFRQYIGTYQGAYPIVSVTGALPFGTMRLTLQNGVVTAYERSLLQLDSSWVREEVSLPGGNELLSRLSTVKRTVLVDRLFPAYQLRIDGEEAVLHPMWVIQLADGTYEALPGGGAF